MLVVMAHLVKAVLWRHRASTRRWGCKASWSKALVSQICLSNPLCSQVGKRPLPAFVSYLMTSTAQGACSTGALSSLLTSRQPIPSWRCAGASPGSTFSSDPPRVAMPQGAGEQGACKRPHRRRGAREHYVGARRRAAGCGLCCRHFRCFGTSACGQGRCRRDTVSRPLTSALEGPTSCESCIEHGRSHEEMTSNHV